MSSWRTTKTKSGSVLEGDLAIRVVDVCLALCLFVAPLWFGGRHDLGRLLYASLAATATIAWATRCWFADKPCLRWSALHLLLLAAIAVVMLQVIPLPPALLNKLSPAIAELAPTWTAASDFPIHMGQWRTLSVTPSATLVGLAVLVSHAILFFVAVERLRNLEDIRRLLLAIAAAAAMMAAFGLVQYLFSNDKLLWFYAHPQRSIGESVQGAFANKNHFAHFVVLGVAPMLAVIYASTMIKTKSSKKKSRQSTKRRPLVWWCSASVVALLAVLFTLSRGGLVALFVTLLVGGLAMLKGGLVGRNTAMSFAGLAATVLLAISFGDVDKLFNRYNDFTTGSIETLDQSGSRQAIWAANLKAEEASPWFGFGVGSHLDVYPAFIDSGFSTVFTHAESGYFHTLTETGLVGGALMLLAILVIGSWCVRGVLTENDPERLLTWAAVSAGLAASAVHSLFDFVWYIPACMCVTVLLAACALRLHQTAREESSLAATNAPLTAPTQKSSAFDWTPLAGFAGASFVALSLLWGPGMSSLAWDRYWRASGSHRQLTASQLSRAFEEDDSKYAELEWLQHQMIDLLEKVVRINPGNARAHLLLAGRRLQQFELSQRDADNAIGLPQLREAALASNFKSQAATIAWLYQAFGENATHLVAAIAHTRTALQLAPLQADGYLHVATLNFLSPPAQRDAMALMEQAVRLAPFDGGVLLEAGKQAAFAGDAELAVEYWKRAHKVAGSHRVHMLVQLAARVPAADYLATFEPEQGLLWALYRQYREKGDPVDLTAISTYAARVAAEPVEMPYQDRSCQATWRLASEIEQRLGHFEAAISYAEQAVAIRSTDYHARRCLLAAYAKAERWDDARAHAHWCLTRKPSDKQVQRWCKESEKNRVAVRVGPQQNQ